MNGNTAPRSNSTPIPKTVYPSDQSATSYHRPWRLAKILSSREPLHPPVASSIEYQDGDDALQRGPVLMHFNGTVEVLHSTEMSLTHQQQDPPHLLAASTNPHFSEDLRRSPLVILLMDPGRKIYELMQLWVDLEDDSVRDVLHAVQQNLGESWRQDYDGLFQVRNHNFNQLIHILNIYKYDIQPHEVWVAKPWAMSAKNTVNYASVVLQHLQSNHTLEYVSCSTLESLRRKIVRNKVDDNVLTLSKAAQARIYVPDGILKHHHACQFLAFSPPFEPLIRVDVLSAEMDDASASQLSESFCGNSVGSEDQIIRVVPGISSSLSAPTTPRPSTPTDCVSEAAPQQQKHSGNLVMESLTSSPVRIRLDVVDSIDEDDRKPPRRCNLLRALSCRKPSRKEVAGTPRTSRLYTTDSMASSQQPLWRVWEEDNDSQASRSIISDSQPLLCKPNRRPDWGPPAQRRTRTSSMASSSAEI
jgi:hypothetical protein